MPKKDNPPGRMIHIRLPEEVHRQMRIRVAELDRTIQHWVAAVVEKELAISSKPSGEGEEHE